MKYVFIAALTCSHFGCAMSLAAFAIGSVTPEKIESNVLPNAYQITERVISGGQPDGEAAFKQLRDLGVRTVISVDGATPNVELAEKYGLRYVHLPHSYDGIPSGRLVELAKAVRELPGLIYIHCHHGKHRSPAAAASACIGAGTMNNSEDLAVLVAAGTGKNYRGLFQSVREAKPIDAEQLASTKVDFQEVAEITPLADAMIEIEHTHDHLKTVASNGWKPTAKHPDIDPPHEALLLQEHYTEILRTDESKNESAAFRQLLSEGEFEAKTLNELLHAKPVNREKIDAAFSRVTANCTACHAKFRDVPLQVKGERK